VRAAPAHGSIFLHLDIGRRARAYVSLHSRNSNWWARRAIFFGIVGEGDFCHCYLVNSTYVFRFAKHAQAFAAMRVERCLLPILRDYLAVAVPHVEFAGRDDDSGQALMLEEQAIAGGAQV